MTIKAGLIILKLLLVRPLICRMAVWKFLAPKKRPRKVSKIPLPKSVKENLASNKTRPESPGPRVQASELTGKPNTSRPTSAPPKRERRSDDFGSRLHNKAQEIEDKKQKIRKSLKVDYSFRPKLAENTNRWLLRNRDTYKTTREEIAVVSSASILNFNRSPPMSSCPFVTQNNENTPCKVNPIILSRSDFKYRDVDLKENFYN